MLRGYSVSNGMIEENMADEILWNNQASKEAHRQAECKVDISEVFRAHKFFSQSDIVQETALMPSAQLSAEFQANISIKREDHHRGRTYKLRAAYYQYMISDKNRRENGYVLASDGNFGLAYAIVAGHFQTKCVIFIPQNCHSYKYDAILLEGKGYVEVIQVQWNLNTGTVMEKQVGCDFDNCRVKALQYSTEHNIPYLLSYETPSLFNGYGTIAKEIVEEGQKVVYDYVLVPAGGGALASAIASVMKQLSPQTKVIAVEPDICKPYSTSILRNELVESEKVSKFCNGSSIRNTSQYAFKMGQTCVDGFVEVTERKLAEMIIKLYSHGVICEPSGALSIAGLTKVRHLIKGKNVVCIMSGANIDITKLDEAREMSVISKGIKNFYIFEVPNKKQVIYNLITECFRVTDLISIQFTRKINKESSQVLLAVESLKQQDVEYSISKFISTRHKFENINDKQQLLDILF